MTDETDTTAATPDGTCDAGGFRPVFLDREPSNKTISSGEPPKLVMPSAIKKSWRDVIPVHPAADMLPLLSDEELLELADDIKAHGLQSG